MTQISPQLNSVEATALPLADHGQLNMRSAAISTAAAENLQTLDDTNKKSSSITLPGEDAIQAYLKAEKQTPRAAPFQPRFLKPNCEPKGLAIIYHGFLGGPWQLQPMAAKLQADGYAVLMPTMPGHGVVDEDNETVISDNVPKSHEWAEYIKFADKTLALAQGTKLPLSVLGFSGGGAIANYVAKKDPSIKASVLIAPFYHPQPKWGQLLMRLVSFLDKHTKDRAGKLFNKVPFDLVKKTTSVPNVKPRDPNKPAHKITSLGSIYALARFGHHTLDLPNPMNSPCLMITSESDDQSDNATSEKMFSKIAGEKSHISIPKETKAPHVFPLKDECTLEHLADMVEEKSSAFIATNTK